ncbi:serologically defined colon cancer antigen 1 [Amniculicola lignicola CBS 123094]|uniref:Ribosome quality control complex subunit 2 n=1 Tax=Amniculicola lignicola CBS 123094 TaxID=1392246 RepID=A0A6A5WK25_9PLEO|nr:serologically defined colon cancer antigen 1 [Amniculicola lignicola CBS 123094]
MKQRFSSLDVKVSRRTRATKRNSNKLQVIAHELNKTICPLRVTNIYDLSSRIFLIKFHKPDHREQLIVESGFRCHLTEYARTTAAAPSGFVARLRKYLKTRRVTKVSQVGTDRIIQFEFSDGLYKLYFEFYAGGNIVLTDKDLKVLALLRNVDEGAEHERLRVGLEYNLSLRQNYGGIPELTKERVRSALQKAVDRQQAPTDTGKKAKKQQKDALRKALAVSITECPPLLVDHALHVTHFDATLKPQQVLDDDSLLEKLIETLQEARKISQAITDPDTVKGYILAKSNPAAPKEDENPDGPSEKSKYLYDDFHPFRPQQFENSEYTFLEFDGFNKAVDEFFSSIEGQKLESRLTERELAAKKKLEQARQEHAKRIGGLQQVQELNYRKAEAITANVHRVTEAIAAVNGLIGQGMDWGEMARLIEREQDQGNAVAQMIKLPLKLYENTVTLLLDELSVAGQEDEEEEGYETSSVSEDSDEEGHPTTTKKTTSPLPTAKQKLAVDIDLGLTAWANSSEYFDQKKSAAGKEERTLLASEKALKSQERKVTEDLKKGLKQEKEILRPVRKQQWFEKFINFISSDGYLVLGGKDAQQNEIIYKRYLRKGDVYVHADLKGAVPVIVKNNPNMPDSPIPPSTLSQAGHLTVSTSEAWDSKAGMSAWWVNGDQVSKTGSTGEFLAPGLFNIKGKKEFLPPAQLVIGLAVMFEISEESKANHRKHRFVDLGAPAPSEAVAERIPETSKIAPSEEDSESGSDEDFPDAKIGSDSEDDFPDAKLEDEPQDSDAESDTAERANPLQGAGARSSIESDSDSEDDAKVAPLSERKTTLPTVPSHNGSLDDDGSIADSEGLQGKPGRRHLSARERRLLRKGQLSDTTAASPESASVAETPPDHDPPSVPSDEDKPATKGPGTVTSLASKADSTRPLPRGKRGKAKKLAAKYADQDEDDRALAMRILGSKSGQQAAEAQAEAKRAKEEEALANKQRRREQHLRVQAVGKAAEQTQQGALETAAGGKDEAADDEAIVQSLRNLDAFTGRPMVGDEILSAFPVCAPWSALSTFKYKVKMQPGSLKRGKAVKDILLRWDAAGKDAKALDKTSTDTERVWPREIELIRGWKEAEVVGVIPVSKVRIMLQRVGGAGGGGVPAAKGKAKAARGGRGSKKGGKK